MHYVYKYILFFITCLYSKLYNGHVVVTTDLNVPAVFVYLWLILRDNEVSESLIFNLD